MYYPIAVHPKLYIGRLGRSMKWVWSNIYASLECVSSVMYNSQLYVALIWDSSMVASLLLKSTRIVSV